MNNENILATIVILVLSALSVYYKFIQGAKIRLISKKHLEKDSNGIYVITFFNKSSREGLINNISLRLDKEECFLLDQSGKALAYPIKVPSHRHLPCVINVEDKLKKIKTDKLRNMFFFFKKKCYKAVLTYEVTCNIKLKNLDYVFYLLEDASI